MIETQEPTKRRLSISFAASVTAHILLAAFITLMQTDMPLKKKQQPEIMDVVLLDPETKPSKTPPKDAKTISNRSAQGASKDAKDRVTRAAKGPLVGQKQQKPKPALPRLPKQPPPSPTQKPQQRTRTLAKRDLKLQSDLPPEKPRKKTRKPTPRKPQDIPLANLMPSTMALAQLSREFERERRMKQMLSREADIPISTREAKYAPYAQALVQALEEQWRPGRANYDEYAEQARRVLMRITIEHNGELGQLEILRPSPLPQLNESAIAAIHAAAPFKPLPSAWGLDRATFYLTFEVIEDRFVFKTL
ncbi:MAG: TonB family protein [Mariprofundaceae bacterium]